MDGEASLAEVISNRFVSPVFNVRMVFFKMGVKGASSFTNVELRASGAMNDIYTMLYVRQLNCDVHLGLRTSNVGIGADERTCSTFCLIAGVFLGVLVAG